ncbi:SPOR domain-containing protein [Brevundimonas goettingensis]|nr:SPOR domain-containing protein [Brevundimonas goettingensis]
MLRPVLVSLALSGVGLTTASCGMVEGDPHRFENLAQQVADIRLDGSEAPVSAAEAPKPLTGTAAESGLRSGLRVEVMDPHELWDARDGLTHAVRQESAAVVEAAAPAVAQAAMGAVVQQVSTRAAEVARPARADGLRSGLSAAPATARTTIQLGAYSSEAAARSAWTTVKAGAARNALNGLSPVFERVTVNGRALTRLKVAAPTAAAVAICRAAQVNDPWCARQA